MQEHKPIRSNIGYAATKHDQHQPPPTKITARDLMWQNGGPGVWAPDYRQQFLLKDPDWRFDAVPEIIDGKNVADFIDPDIQLKLAALENEEEQIAAQFHAAHMDNHESDLESDEEATIHAIRDAKNKARIMSNSNRGKNHPIMPRAIRGKSKHKHDPGLLSAPQIKSKMDAIGVDSTKMIERGRKRERDVPSRRQQPSLPPYIEHDDAVPMDTQESPAKLPRIGSCSRSRTRTPTQAGLKDQEAVGLASKQEKKGRKSWQKVRASGEGDRRQTVHLIKWCNTGKKRMGTHYCR